MTGVIAPKPVHAGMDSVAASLTASAAAASSSAPAPAASRSSSSPRKSAKPRTPTSTTPSRPPSRTERRFACTFAGCVKAYFKPSRLAEHQRTHTGERPHVCDQCGQTYLRASHLAAHQRTHKSEAEKEFACPRPGCEKRFWTATHLQRHEAAHDSAQIHECDVCGETFAKTHLLREHVASTHMPDGSRPWACSHEGCGRTFGTKQQLRTHEKTHDPTRYTCSHPIHGLHMPSFPVWSALQAHIRDAHPPTCPHAECEGRTFKSSGRLREHLRVHAEREADIAAGRATSDTDDLPPVLAEAVGRRKKRKLSEVGMDDPRVVAALKAEGTLLPTAPSSGASTPTTPRKAKLPRLVGGEAGKDWICGAPGCGARFKTKFARDEHAQAAHSSGRHKCDVCGRSYRRPASLKRHKAQGWCGQEGEEETGSGDRKRARSASGTRTPRRARVDDVGAGDLLTGAATLPGGLLHRRWGCPYIYPETDDHSGDDDVIQKAENAGGNVADTNREDDGSDPDADSEASARGLRCPDRFHRVYDVRRHLASAHGIVLDDLATREMLLADGQTGEDM